MLRVNGVALRRFVFKAITIRVAIEKAMAGNYIKNNTD
jgi:hypothetical protein